jgi:serine/threonine-protein kinase
MQSSLIDGLSRVRNLRVTSKVSTLPFRQAGGSLLDVAMQLGVARVVEGTVLRDGDRVSIALRMHDAEQDEQVWSARFEDDLTNIMYLQAQAAQEIANQVRVQLGQEEREQFASARPVNPEAYLAALKGNFHSERFNPEDARIAEMHYQRAIDIDPEYALGHWGLNKVCAVRAQAGLISPEEARKTCLPLALQAMELDPFLPEAHMAMAGILTWHHFDWEGARPHWERALELNPSYAEAHIFYGHYLGIIGELDRSKEHAEKALELDPLNPFTVGLNGAQHAIAGRFEEAIAAVERSFAMSPGHAFGYMILVWAHDALGNEKEAIEAKVNNLRYAMGAHDLADFLVAAYADGNYEMANLRFAEELVRRSESGHMPPMLIAASYERAGDYDLAMDWYEKAFEQGDPDTPYLGAIIKDPDLRHHPRFKLLVEKMGLHYWAENL